MTRPLARSRRFGSWLVVLWTLVLLGVVASSRAADPAPPAATSESKPAESKPAESKPAESPPAEAPAAEAKAAEAKAAEAKAESPAAAPPAATVVPPREPRLRFNFRFQRWSDVLQWFAEQADLSLVIDAPPPGTFNYSDTREYTPTEAIDLLNGVLASKGYSLVRRDRMLVVVDLKAGVPEGLIPRIGLEELAHRGKFELVSVLFALEGKNAEQVQTEIKPLLGPFGKVVVLPATKQILVTATAGSMEAIKTVIVSIPVPAAAPPAERPELASYPLGSAARQAVLDVLKVLLPEAKLVFDEKTQQFSAFATPSQQAAIKRVLEQMQGNLPEEKRPRLEVYPLNAAMNEKGSQPGDKLTPAEKMVAVLKSIFPDAQLTHDPASSKLIVWASAANQESIKATLDKLQSVGPGDQSRQLEVYHLNRVNPATVVASLQTLVPTARLTVDAKSRSLMALASAEDQKTIQATLEQLEMPGIRANGAELRFYPVADMPSPSVLAVLVQQVPDAQVTPEPDKRRLMVLATPAEHEVVQKLLQQTAAAPADARQLVVYPLGSADPTSTMSLLQTQMPTAQFILDAKANRIMVWARPTEHETIRNAMAQLQAGSATEGQARFEVYAVQKSQIAQVQSTLQTLVPTARITLDPKNEKLVVWGTPRDQEQVKAAIDKLQVTVSPETTPQLEVYRLQKGEPGPTVALLQGMVPEAKITVDPATKSLAILAVPKDHETIKAMLEQLQPKERLPNAPEMHYYDLKQRPPATFMTGLQTLAPTAQLTLDPNGTRLMVVASPADHETIKATLAQLESATTPETTPQIEVYRLSKADPTTTMGLLQGVVPGAKITVDAANKSLVIQAVPKEHETVKAMLEQLQPKERLPNAPEMRYYDLKQRPPATFMTGLQTLAPTAQITLDPNGTRLMVVASPADHETIKGTLAQLESATTPETTPQIEVYRLSKADPTTTMGLLQGVVPGAKITVDAPNKSLVIQAVPKEHETIRAMLEQLQPKERLPNAPEMRYYDLKERPPAPFLPGLQVLVPTAQVTLDPSGTRLMVVATPADHETIKGTLAQLESATTPETTPQMEVYRLSKAEPNAAVALLQSTVPGAKITLDAATKSLAILAVPKDHQAIKALLEQLQSTERPPNAPELRYYELKQRPPATLMSGLAALTPTAQITLDPNGKRLMVVATPADHATIQATLDKVTATVPPEEKNKLVTYPVTAAQRTRFMAVVPTITAELPGIQVINDATPGELSVWAKPQQHETIKQIIDELKREVPAEEKYQLVAYPLKAADPAVVLTTVQSVFPGVQCVVDRKTRRIMIYARPDQHEVIKAAIEQMDSAVPAETKEAFKIYPVNQVSPALVVQTMQELAPDARIIPDGPGNRVLVWATPRDQQVVAKTLEEMQTPDERYRPKVAVYPSHGFDPYNLASMLRTLVPGAQVSVNTASGSLAVFAAPKDQEAIAAAIQGMRQQSSGENAPQFVSYSLGHGNVNTLLHVLRNAVPQAQLAMGKDVHELVAFARAEDHEVIKKLAEQIAQKPAEGVAPTLALYTVESGPIASALQVLRQAAPEAQYTQGTDARTLLVWARPADQEIIQGILSKLAEQGKAEGGPTLAIYPLESSAVLASTLQVVRTTVPEAQISVGSDSRSLIVWARAAEHEKVQQTLQQLADKKPEDTPTLVTYTIDNVPVASALQMLRAVAPDAQYAAGTDPGTAIIRARPADHERIKAALDELTKAPSEETAPAMVVYPLKHVPAAEAIRVLTTTVPQAKLTVGTDPQQLVVTARAVDQERIKKALEQIDVEQSKETAATAVTYALKGSASRQAGYLLNFLRTSFPQANFTMGADPNQLVAYAKPRDHERIAQLVEQMSKELPPEATPVMANYPVAGTTAQNALGILQRAFPQTQFAVGADNRSLLAWARPDEQKEIEVALARLAETPPDPNAPTMATYNLDKTTAASLSQLLATSFPQARFTAGADPYQLLVWASPKEHERIAEAVQRATAADATAGESTMAVYTLDATTATSAMYVLRAAIPQAQFAVGANPYQLVAWARPKDQEAIRAAVEKMSKTAASDENGPRLVSYPVPGQNAQSVLRVVQNAIPQGQFSVSPDYSQLLAWARPKEHEIIRAALEQMRNDASLVDQRTMAVYPCKGADADALIRVLTPTMRDHAQLATDAHRTSLIVWADRQYQEAIQKTIEDYLKQTSQVQPVTSKVYRFQVGEPEAALAALRRLVPEAQASLDQGNRSLVVSAMPEDHAKVEQLVAEMDREDQSQAPRVELYPLTAADPHSVSQTLRAFYQRRHDVQISLDENTNSLVALAPPLEQKKIASLIAETEKLAVGEQGTRLQTYSLENINPSTILSVLTNLLDKKGPKVQMSIDSHNNQLLVQARPHQHAIVAGALEQLRREARGLEIFQLETVDPMSAQMAIDRQYADNRQAAPEVDIDPITQQLLIRATPKQLTEVRELLVKLGETSLTTGSTTPNSRIRTIRCNGDVPAMLRELQRLWPQMRSNDLRILDTATPAAQPKDETPKTDAPKVEEPSPNKSSQHPAGRSAFRLAAFEKEAPQAETPQPAKPEPAKPEPGSPPVVIMPGEGQITIASDDPEALNQLESLVRSLSQPGGEIGRNFHAYPLKYTSAVDIADTIEELFRDNRSSWRRSLSPVVVVPDERMNALLVQANRIDRTTIENLLKVLDTDEVPETPASHRPRLIPIKNTEAVRVEQVIREMYRSQLASGTRRRSRAGSATWTPQISVDPMTNSLIVMAPAPLIDDIAALAQSLDETAASNPARSVSLVRLKTTNSQQVQRALDLILRDNARRRK